MFKLIIGQLRVLGDGEQESAALRSQAGAILRSLSTVRSHLALVALLTDEEGEVRERAEGLTHALLDALLEAQRPGMSKGVEEDALSVIAAVLGEVEALPPRLADLLLGWLLQAGTHPRGAALAAEVLRRDASLLMGGIAEYLSARLQGREPGGGMAEDEEDEEGRKRLPPPSVPDRHAALRATLALPPCLPSALDTLIPVLTEDCGREDAVVRRTAVEALGALFLGPPVPAPSSGQFAALGRVPLGVLHTSSFATWAGRFNDKDTGIRSIMAELGGAIVREHGSGKRGDALCARLESAMADTEESVRFSAVKAASDVIVWSLAHAPPQLVGALISRCKDVMAAVRKEAATGLAQAYGTAMPALWRRAEEWSEANPPPEGKEAAKGLRLKVLLPPALGALPPITLTQSDAEAAAKLSAVPSAVLGLYRLSDPAMRQLAVQLLDNVLLPEKREEETLSEEVRARGLAGLYAGLDAAARRTFADLQHDRALVQSMVVRLTVLRGEAMRLKGGAGGGLGARAGIKEDKERAGVVEAELERVFCVLVENAAKLAPERERAALRRLVGSVPDSAVFRLLASLMDVRTPAKRARLAREDLFQRVAAAAAAMAPAAVPAGGKKESGKGGAPPPDAGADGKAVKDVVRYLVRKGALGTCSPGMVGPLVALATEAVGRGALVEAAAVLALLEDLAGAFPALLTPQPPTATATGKGAGAAAKGKAGAGGEEEAAAAAATVRSLTSLVCLATLPSAAPATAAVVRGALTLLSALGRDSAPGAASPAFTCLPSPVQADVRTLLTALTTNGPPALAKAAVGAAAGLLASGDAVYRAGSRAQGGEEEGEGGAAGSADPWFASLLAAVNAARSKGTTCRTLPSLLMAYGSLALKLPSCAGKEEVLAGLVAFITADPEEDEEPEGGVAAALAAQGLSSDAAGTGRVGEEEGEDEEGEEEGEEASDDDRGFIRPGKGGKKGAKAAGTKRKAAAAGLSASATSSKRSATTTSSDLPVSYKGMAPSFSALCRALAIRALGCAVRGRGCRSTALSALSVQPGAGSEVTEAAKAAGGAAVAALDRLTALVARIAEAGGDLTRPRGSQVLGVGHAGSSQEDVDAAVMRVAASVALLRAAGDVPKMDRRVTLAAWRAAVMSPLDCCAPARAALARTLLRRVPSLPTRYLPALALAAACTPAEEGRDVRARARDALSRAAVAGVKAAEGALARAGGAPAAVAAAYALRPELCLPHALYLLALDAPRAPTAAEVRDVVKAAKAATGAAADPVAICRKLGVGREHSAVLACLVDAALDAAKTTAGEGGRAGALSLLHSVYHRLGDVDVATEDKGAAVAFEGLRALLFYAVKARATSSKAYDRHGAEGVLPLPGALFRPSAEGAQKAAT